MNLEEVMSEVFLLDWCSV